MDSSSEWVNGNITAAASQADGALGENKTKSQSSSAKKTECTTVSV